MISKRLSEPLRILCAAMLLGLLAGVVAQALVALIGLVTNLAYYGRWSTSFVSPADHHLGPWAIGIPVIGGLIVGVMARYGSKAIRGHGIPEAMEQVLLNQSRIPLRMTWLKPISSAIAIGTGGPFGAEGPIIATGGALGSAIGQLLHTTAHERKTLLAAGAAAGMTATFGSPISAVLLAIELLLFEYRAKSFIPVAMAAVVAAAVRLALVGSSPVFPMPLVMPASGPALLAYLLEGALIGLVAVLATKATYGIEDLFEKLPVHWLWWPAIGGLCVGLIGQVAPHTLGVGYDNIEHIISGDFVGTTMLVFCLLKFLSWSIALGSGTSGGTLAPLFTIGGGLGSAFGSLMLVVAPAVGVDLRVAALVGMAAIFAGASRALLASVVFAFETTGQIHGLLPLLGGCTMAHFVSTLIMRNTIMTEKIARRGTYVPSDYHADHLENLRVLDYTTTKVATLAGSLPVKQAQTVLTSRSSDREFHQGYPVVDDGGRLLGMVTRRDLWSDKSSTAAATLADLIAGRKPVTISGEANLREATNLLLEHGIGRLLVVDSKDQHKLCGILTRSDLLKAESAARSSEVSRETSLSLRRLRRP